MPDYLSDELILQALAGPRRPQLGLTDEELAALAPAAVAAPPAGLPKMSGREINALAAGPDYWAPSQDVRPRYTETPASVTPGKVPFKDVPFMAPLGRSLPGGGPSVAPSIQENIQDVLAQARIAEEPDNPEVPADRETLLASLEPGAEPAGGRGGPEPWESMAAQQAYQKRVDDARWAEAMSASLQQLGEGLSGVRGYQVKGEPVSFERPYVSTGAAAVAQEQVSPATQELLQRSGIPIPPGMTQAQLQATLPVLMQGLGLQQRQATESRRVKQDEFRNALAMAQFEQNQQNVNANLEVARARTAQLADERLSRVARDFDGKIQGLKTNLVSARTALELVRSGSISQAATVVAMARASGERGNLSEADKAPFQARMGIWNGFVDKLHKALKGELSEPVKRELEENAKIYINAAARAMRDYGHEVANREYRVREEARKRFGSPQEFYDEVLGIDTFLGAEGEGGGTAPVATETSAAPVTEMSTVPAEAPLYRIPASDKEAIRQATEDGINFEIIQ